MNEIIANYSTALNVHSDNEKKPEKQDNHTALLSLAVQAQLTELKELNEYLTAFNN